MNKHTKLAVLSSLLAVLFSLSARAGLYTYNFTGDSGPIPQSGTVLSFEHAVSPGEYVITSIQIILTFNDKTSLTGNSSGIQGLLNLGTDPSSPFVSFYPDVTRTSQGNRIFDVTFSGASGTPGAGFDGLNPNATWGLVLWDHSTSGIGNGLISWTLSITAVPEPVTLALGWFASVFIGITVIRQISIKKKPQQAR